MNNDQKYIGFGTLRLIGLLVLWSVCADGFTPTRSFSMPSKAFTRCAYSSSRPPLSMVAKSIVVVSPPGGVGEVTAVKAASMGGAVKWFVVSSDSAEESTTAVALPKTVLNGIEAAGGSVELAGAEASTLLKEASTRKAASTWCGQADAIVCCLDGTENVRRTEEDRVDPSTVWKGAVKVATKEVCAGISGTKLAVLSIDDGWIDDTKPEDNEEDDNEGKRFGLFSRGGNDSTELSGTTSDDERTGSGLLGFLGGGPQVSIPSSLSSAMGTSSTKLRHGQLFGTPESSVSVLCMVSSFHPPPPPVPIGRSSYCL